MRRNKNTCDICKENCHKHPYHFTSIDGVVSTLCARNRGQAIRINRADEGYYPSKSCKRSKTL
jgi:hypothetical protein